MDLIHVDKLKSSDLQRRRFVCNLPTEFVADSRAKLLEREFDRVYCYDLPKDLWGEYKIEGLEIRMSHSGRPYIVSNWGRDPRLLEIHFDCGDDGHIEYAIQKYYIVIDAKEIPWGDSIKYRKLVDSDEVYDTVRGGKNRAQMTFNDYSRVYYNYLFGGG